VNAYQQQYPPFPELKQSKKTALHTQCQTDPLTFASLSDNKETRMKLHAALEELGNDSDFEAETSAAEILAAEQRDSALKKFAEKEAARLESLKPRLITHSRPLHLPHRNLHQAQQFNTVDNASRDMTRTIMDHVVQRDSVARLREMLKQTHNEYGTPQPQMKNSRTNGSSIQSTTRKLPKRVFDAVREPPQLTLQNSKSVMSLADKIRNLDVTKTEWGSEHGSLYIENETASSVLHQKLKQLPSVAQAGGQPAVVIGATYSLRYSLQSRQSKSGNLCAP
jgi:hypothetical protein